MTSVREVRGHFPYAVRARYGTAGTNAETVCAHYPHTTRALRR